MGTSDLQLRDTGNFGVRAPEVDLSGNSVENGGHGEPFIATVIRKRWRIFVLLAVVSGLAAAGVAYRFSKKTYQCTASLMEAGLPVRNGSYSTPSLGTNLAVLTSHSVMSRLIDKHGLAVPPQVFAARIGVRLGKNRADTIELDLKWRDGDEGVAILNDLIEMFAEELLNARQGRIEQYVGHTQQLVVKSTLKVDAARQRLQTLRQEQSQSQQDQATFNRELALQTSRVESVRRNLDDAEISKTATETRLAAFKKKFDLLAKKLAEEQKQLRLKAVEDTKADYEAQLEAYAPQAEQRAKLEELVGKKLTALAAAIDDEKRAAEWPAELDKLRLLLKLEPYHYPLETMASLSQESEHVQAQIEEDQLRLVVGDSQMDRLKKRIADEEAKLTRLAESAETADDSATQLEEDVAEADAERKQLQGQLTELRQLQEYNGREFKVLNPPVVIAASGNQKKLFVSTMFIGFMSLAALVVFRDFFSQSGHSWLRQFGLPVFLPSPVPARVRDTDSTAPKTTPDDSIRLLATRIQQAVPQAGSVVLFSALERDRSTFSLLGDLAQCLAERDERVMILDAGKSVVADRTELVELCDSVPQITAATVSANKTDGKGGDAQASGSPQANGNGRANASGDDGGDNAGGLAVSGTSPRGLSDYLSNGESGDLSRFVLKTRHPDVDCICAGTVTFPREGLAKRRMDDLLSWCRANYSLTLIAGPSSSQFADLQMAAFRSDAMVLALRSDGQLDRRTRETVADLLDLSAPVIGVVG